MNKVGERIKLRREELGYSQAQLAEQMGYSDRSTIAKIEKGVNDITQSKVVEFAHMLETTPSYLMGWTNDPYDYDTDPKGVLSEIPDSWRKEWLKQDLSPAEMYHRYISLQSEHDDLDSPQTSTPAPTDDQIRAAFFNGADPDLSEEEQKEMWEAAKSFIQFQIMQKKQKENK